MLVVTCAFMSGASLGIIAVHNDPAYVQRLFSTDRVHTVDIVVSQSDWDEMLANAQAEEYIKASVVIDGESVKGVGLRPKGNSSLSTIAQSDSDRYSFKIEFDHYVSGGSYYGLDKLVLNNIAQDNTYMKDYVTYQMMNVMGADAPLTSFIWVTVNGEDWGLYLAAEGIEESFAQRVYGNDYGKIYKPDTTDLNDRDNWDGGDAGGNGAMPGFSGGEMPNFEDMPNFEGGEMPDWSNGERPQGGRPDFNNGEMPDWGNGELPQDGMPDFGNSEIPGSDTPSIEGTQTPESGDTARSGRAQRGGGFGGMFGGGSSAVTLKYIDDDPDSYSAIFDNAKFKVSEADKTRLIKALKRLSEGENIAEVVNTEELMRYFAVHNFVLNSDSYTGSMIHNYYLYEEDGRLSMIAWDYNLAFGGMGMMGGFGGGMGGFGNNGGTAQTDTAAALVNYPIDSPMLSGEISDRPMIAWIFENEEYLDRYHEILSEYMAYFDSGAFAEMYDKAIALISPYMEKDPTAFCTYEAFQTGQSELREFCLLRAESIKGQLDGTIASTSEGQTETANANFTDASSVDMESMGSSAMGFGMARGGNRPGNLGGGTNGTDATDTSETEPGPREARAQQPTGSA
jgi:spore coat protein CotH